MEEVGAQISPSIFIHQPLPAQFCEGHPNPMAKKRNLSFQVQQQLASGFQIPGNIWKPKDWDWDCVRFAAKPLESDVLHLGTSQLIQSEQHKIGRESSGISTLLEKNPVDQDNEILQLQLGGSSNSLQECVSRPNKRVRSGSPGGGGSGNGSYPVCQVDNCREDLSKAKDYHRRHKVCEIHSKSSTALVGKQIQRFCQQCSRFHHLSEFDEGKRSCGHRLAGHSRRRRKTQTEDVSSRMLLPGSHDNAGNGDLDIVNLLTVLARAQGNEEVNSPNCSSVPNKDQLIQILSKMNLLPLPVDFETKLPVSESLTSTVPEQSFSDYQNKLNRNMSSASTKDLLAVLSATLAASTPDALAILSQRSSQGVEADKTKLACLEQALSLYMQRGTAFEFPSVGGESSNTSYQYPVEDSDCQVQEIRANLPLQLFSSSPEGDSLPKLTSARKYFSSGSSNPMEETSPSSSPSVVQKLFPRQTTRETELERISAIQEVKENVEISAAHGCVTSLELFGGSNRGADSGSFQTLPYQAGYTSSSGSDHSPSSLNSEAQVDRTGRIIFKLFGKDPSQLPGTLRTQVYNWLSHSPSEMESYIRPGCVVLSIYISMSSSSWEQLEGNLLQHVNSLVWDSATDFWRNGRFLVHTGRQLACHKDGKIRLCKSWTAWRPPELISVSPLAVVGGQETSLFLRGRNLNIPGTKIHCTHGYLSKEVPGSACQETIYDERSLVRFKINGVSPAVLGRCFIEVENGFKGTSFPVIIADANICQELRLLESELDEAAKIHDTISENQICNFGRPGSKEEVLHFLNELGWLFQRKRNSSTIEVPDYTLTRFKFLFIFTVERDFCALVRTLLDMLLQRDLDRGEPSRESLEILSEICLLNRAVKRRCRNMVELLIHYSVLSGNDTFKYIFPPNLVGPGCITPLHLAACTSSSDDIVDALTSDPQEIGLHCWNSLLDANGLSPYAYALMRNNHSSNRLVTHKLADRKNGQVSVSIGNEIEQQCLRVNWEHQQRSQFKRGQRSCSNCAVVATRYNSRIAVSQGLLHRPYMHSILAIAAVCVCVCLFMRGHPNVNLVNPFKWENLGYGPM
ncbi:squamosa promoter-binding-like protein 14 isoform X1 [Camellia sinensis]|uniref:squamosa promoter-binding-like protein 14 isoform X1 n=1 Tax=Camellia sinensis TaxID=4442 RepID=UPI001036B597|nr:squamosa promoter-binding-like protein 14 isoform X1 [Camellia sinensis]